MHEGVVERPYHLACSVVLFVLLASLSKRDPLGTEIVASKTILSKTGRKIGNMEIDACSYEQPGVDEFHENDLVSETFSSEA